jgi:hypothetical protein
VPQALNVPMPPSRGIDTLGRILYTMCMHMNTQTIISRVERMNVEELNRLQDETTSVARDLGATSETASKGARWLASSPHHTRGRYLGIRGPAEKEGPVRACVAALPRWSGWLYAHQTLWLDPGPDWDEEKVAEFLAMCAST